MYYQGAKEAIDKPMFLKFVEHYFKQFKYGKYHLGLGKWTHEWQDMEDHGLFELHNIRALYIRMLNDTFTLGFIKSEPIWHICGMAVDATNDYYRALYKICVITGETAVDDDGDEYIELTYDEAKQICKSLNDEAEEELFVIKEC